MFKKEKVQEDPARDRRKPTATNDETAAYEDSWYRSLKALADRRRNHEETHPTEDELRPNTNGHAARDEGRRADADVHPDGGVRRAVDDEDVRVPED